MTCLQWGSDIVEEPPGSVNITSLCCRLLDAIVSHQYKRVCAAALWSLAQPYT